MMSLLVSKTGLIDDCETQIVWNGIESITSNGEIRDLYLFRDALTDVGSTLKLAIIQQAVAIYEAVNDRRPTDAEAFEVGCAHWAEFSLLDAEYYRVVEDLQSLCLAHAQRNPREKALLKEDVPHSEAAAALLAKLG